MVGRYQEIFGGFGQLQFGYLFVASEPQRFGTGVSDVRYVGFPCTTGHGEASNREIAVGGVINVLNVGVGLFTLRRFIAFVGLVEIGPVMIVVALVSGSSQRLFLFAAGGRRTGQGRFGFERSGRLYRFLERASGGTRRFVDGDDSGSGSSGRAATSRRLWLKRRARRHGGVRVLQILGLFQQVHLKLRFVRARRFRRPSPAFRPAGHGTGRTLSFFRYHRRRCHRHCHCRRRRCRRRRPFYSKTTTTTAAAAAAATTTTTTTTDELNRQNGNNGSERRTAQLPPKRNPEGGGREDYPCLTLSPFAGSE